MKEKKIRMKQSETKWKMHEKMMGIWWTVEVPKKMHMKIMGVEWMVDLTKKKHSVKWMVNVKNAYENDWCWTNGRFD